MGAAVLLQTSPTAAQQAYPKAAIPEAAAPEPMLPESSGPEQVAPRPPRSVTPEPSPLMEPQVSPLMEPQPSQRVAPQPLHRVAPLPLHSATPQRSQPVTSQTTQRAAAIERAASSSRRPQCGRTAGNPGVSSIPGLRVRSAGGRRQRGGLVRGDVWRELRPASCCEICGGGSGPPPCYYVESDLSVLTRSRPSQTR